MGLADKLRQRYAALDRNKALQGIATKDDVKKLSRELDNNLRRQGQPSGGQIANRAVKMMGRGFGDIGRSLASPANEHRPRISQMPARRRDIGIAGHIDLNAMKSPQFRHRDLRGRRTK